ncbi:hypothetical protein [Comamonas composti]|uniref:hypothetical protein n=1 Tax=Comamonas composti TaxID=408558 RepID=UPI0012EB20B8|nr:hypothetical protein [Comamonas composti]
MRAVRIVIPRSLCLYQRISCLGVPRLRLASFAQIQVQSHSPFARTGSFALQQDQWLHLWLWNKELEDQIEAGHASAQRFLLWPSSLLSTPAASGVSFQRLPQAPGIELLLWSKRQLVDSLWFETLPTPVEWSELLAQTPELIALGWPPQLPDKATAQTPGKSVLWGRNLTPRPESRRAVQWPTFINAGLAVATVGMMAWAAWTYGQKIAAQQVLDEGLQSSQSAAAALEPLLRVREQAQNTVNWLHQADSLVPQPSTGTLLSSLSSTWPRQGVVLRELEISAPTVQATFVSATAGSPIKLTTILDQIASNPLFYDARFIDVSGDGFKFSWRIKASADSQQQVQE